MNQFIENDAHLLDVLMQCIKYLAKCETELESLRILNDFSIVMVGKELEDL